MKIQYDPVADAAYIRFVSEIQSGGVAKSLTCDPTTIRAMVNLDFDSSGKLLGIEVLGAKQLLPEELLRFASANYSVANEIALARIVHQDTSDVAAIQFLPFQQGSESIQLCACVTENAGIHLCFTPEHQLMGLLIEQARSILPPKY